MPTPAKDVRIGHPITWSIFLCVLRVSVVNGFDVARSMNQAAEWHW